MSTNQHAPGAGMGAPARSNDEAAAELIEGESYSQAWLDRLNTGMAQPGELAVILSFLTGEMLNGACRRIERALEGKRHE